MNGCSSWPLWACLLTTVAGCSGVVTIEHACTASIEHALEVRVEDALTGAPIAEDAIALAREGAFSEQLRVVGWMPSGPGRVATTLGGADERPGTYEVEIQRSGYARWDTTAIRVRKGPCHVETARMVARLQRLP